MINSIGIRQRAIKRTSSRSRRQTWLLGLGIAVLFYLVVAVICMAPQVNAAQVPGEAHEIVSHVFVVGDYTLTMYADNSFELAWESQVTPLADTRAAGAWVSSRGGSLAINRD